MAAAHSSFFMNPQQFKDIIPSKIDPIMAVNLPKSRRGHQCTSNNKTRPLQLKDGAIEGPRRLRVGHQRSLPDNDNDFRTSGLDDPLLADVVSKAQKCYSSCRATMLANYAKWIDGYCDMKDPLLADLVAESIRYEKLKQEFEDSKTLYMLQRMHKLYSTIRKFNTYGEMCSPMVAKWLKKYEFTFPSKHYHEIGYLAPGVKDPLVTDIVTKQLKYFSSVIAELSVNAARRRLGANAVDKEPLWADLVAESKLCEKLQKEYQDSKLHYMKRRLVLHFTSEEDFEGLLCNFLKEYLKNTNGQQYSDVVTKWFKKYGFTLLDDLTRSTWGLNK